MACAEWYRRCRERYEVGQRVRVLVDAYVVGAVDDRTARGLGVVTRAEHLDRGGWAYTVRLAQGCVRVGPGALEAA